MSARSRLESWTRYQGTVEAERQRLCELAKPPVKNPAHLMRPTKIRRIGRGFFINSHAVQMGEIAVTDFCTAQSLVALGKAQFVTEEAR